MKSFLLGLLTALALSASAAPVAKQGNDSVTLLESACPDKIMQIVAARGIPDSFVQRAGVASVGGKLFQLCWTPLPDGRVGLIYEDGDMGAIPLQMFHDDPGA